MIAGIEAKILEMKNSNAFPDRELQTIIGSA